MHKSIAAALAVLAMASPALAGNTSSIYGAQGQYQGRVVTQPGSNTSNVYSATGQYLGRITQQPDGSRQAHDASGGYLGRSQPQPQTQTDGGQGGE